MKNLYTWALGLLLALCCQAAGAQTPTDDTFTVSDLTWDEDEEAYYFTVSLKGSRIYSAYNLGITLPIGISPVYDDVEEESEDHKRQEREGAGEAIHAIAAIDGIDGEPEEEGRDRDVCPDGHQETAARARSFENGKPDGSRLAPAEGGGGENGGEGVQETFFESAPGAFATVVKISREHTEEEAAEEDGELPRQGKNEKGHEAADGDDDGTRARRLSLGFFGILDECLALVVREVVPQAREEKPGEERGEECT